MVDYFTILFFQIAFNFLKVLEIQLSYENQTTKLLIVTVFLSILALLSTFLSINLLLDGDFYVVFSFVGGSVIGKWLASTFFRSNYRSEVYQRLQRKKKKI
jgi:hypothetical protein